jgi:plastocyanin
MKSNLYYVGILAMTLLVLSGPASFATPTDPTQLTETTEQTETPQEGIVTVSIGEGSNATVQQYTYTPNPVEINAGESVTWFTPGEIVDIHTVTFVQDPSVLTDLILPFAVPAGGATEFELLPPFNIGEPILIQAPGGREAIVALNKHAWYPAVLDANNQTTFLEGTDIQATLNSSVKALNSGIIVPQMPPMGGAQLNSTQTGTAGEEQIPSPVSLMNDTTAMTNATGTTTDVLTVPDDQGTSQPTQGAAGEQTLGPPFPPVSSFTVTFEEPGTYTYFCAIHPWMGGQVVVRGDIPTETPGQNQTETQTQPSAAQTETPRQNQTETGTQLPANETTTTTPGDQDVPLSDPDADRPTTPPQAQTETPGAGEQQPSPNPIFG